MITRAAQAPRRALHALLFLAVVALAAVQSGCASRAQDLSLVREALWQGDVDRAWSEYEKVGGKDSDLLHLLEKGYLLHLSGRWRESNEAFEQAETRAEDLYTKSVTREGLALLTSDRTLPYRGSPHELQLVQYYRALNYLELGQFDEALVEARKANYLSSQLYDDEDEDEAAQNAFLDYFTGMLYAANGEWNDAAVALRRAYDGYGGESGRYGVGTPPGVKEDLGRSLMRTGQSSEARRLGVTSVDSGSSGSRRLIVFFEAGYVPQLESVDITIPIFDRGDDDQYARAGLYVDRYGAQIYDYRDPGNLDHVLRFAFPRLEDLGSAVSSCELELSNGRTVRGYPVLDLSAIARDDFNRKLPKILLKTIARAFIKEAERKAAKKENEVLGWVVNAINLATEQADTRSLILLPGTIYAAEIEVPPGVDSVKARFLDRFDQTVDEWTLDVSEADNRTEILSLRSFR